MTIAMLIHVILVILFSFGEVSSCTIKCLGFTVLYNCSTPLAFLITFISGKFKKFKGQ